MRLRDLFFAQQLGRGGNTGGGGDVTLTEITITKNGTYEPTGSVELGGTYTFKEELKEADIINLHASGNIDEEYGDSLIAEWGEGYEYSMGINKYEEGYVLWYGYIDTFYEYYYESYAEQVGEPSAGWFAWPPEGEAYKVTAPTITLPENADSFYGDINLLAPLFDIPSVDGFNRVVVNVAGGTHAFKALADGTLFEITPNMLSGITTIAPYAFCLLKDLEFVEIPEGVTEIQYRAFSMADLYSYVPQNCDRNFMIPASVTNIGKGAFEYNAINEMVFLGTEPPDAQDGDPFYYGRITTMYVPKGCASVYDTWIHQFYLTHPTIVEMD